VSKWLVLLLIVTAFTGTYWAVMSGCVADRMVAMAVRSAAREHDPQAVVDALREAENGLDWQQRWVERFGFIAKDPDWSRARESREKLHRLQKEATNILRVAGGELGSEGTEQLRRFLQAMPPLRTGVFREGQETPWRVGFWLAAVGTALLGLVVFVRRMAE